MAGLIDHTSSIGPIVAGIVSHPEKTLGRYVWGTNGEGYTIGEIFALYAKAAGLKDVKYIQVSDESFESLHGKLGVEVGLMFKLWQSYAVYSEAEDLVLPSDLGVTGLKTLKEHLGEQDWSAFL